MAKTKKPSDNRPISVGDTVVWRGLKLVVIEVHEDGQLTASTQTMRVYAPATDFTVPNPS